FFPKGTATLFGTFDLSELLLGAALDQNAPKMRTRTEDVPGGKLITATLDWEPGLANRDLGIAAFEKDHGGTSRLRIHGTIQKPVTLGGPPPDGVKAEFTGTLNHFRVSVLKSVFVNFTEFGFATRGGQKPDLKVALDPTTPV